MEKNFLSDVIRAKKESIEKIKRGRHPFFMEEGFFLIGEIKLSSPSIGIINPQLDIASQIEAYEKGGVSAISVVTEERFFNGSPELLKKVRSLTRLPILRKDFIIDEIQIYETLLLGADLILLISSILPLKKLKSFIRLCHKIGLTPLVEVHSEKDVEKAYRADARLIGINNRNLKTLEVSIENTIKLMPVIKDRFKEKEITIISESGISSPDQVKILKSVGIKGILVGHSLLTTGNPAEKVRELLSV